MIKLRLAKTAGFCPGVRNAISVAEQAAQNGPVYTYGPLIHNGEVLKELREKGISELAEKAEPKPGDRVVIRAHGVGRAEYEALAQSGAEVIDATCPFVKKIHHIAEGCAETGEKLLILGDPNHPEVRGICGWCGESPIVLSGIDEAERFEGDRSLRYALVAQTTFNELNFKKIVEILDKKEYNLHIYTTICRATSEHQEEALRLASECDAMLVIGDRHSSNTNKLYELCRSVCEPTYFVETANDISPSIVNPEDRLLTVGITAGASTPDHIIQEVVNKMSDTKDFEELLNASLKPIHNGNIVRGTVVQVNDEKGEIVFNIGFKSDGIMTRNDFGGTDEPLSAQIHEGDEIDVQVVHVGESEVLVSRRRLLQDKSYNDANTALEENTVLIGTVIATAENGITVGWNDEKVFIPGRLVELRRVEDFSPMMGQEVNFRLIRVQRRRGALSLLGDRRTLLAEQRDVQRAETLSKIEVGARMKGVVRTVTNYCAFVDLGGVDGMLHLSEMGWKVIRFPSQYVKEGQEIEVFVKAFDPETKKISLSTKFPDENPWAEAEEKYAVGNVVTGKVVRFASFGAFVELEKGVDALIHISHMSKGFVKDPSEVLTIGQEIEAKVIDFDADKKRISLSLRDMAADEEPEEAPEEATEE